MTNTTSPDFSALVKLVQSSIYHARINGDTIVSTLHVNVPITGGASHALKLQRDVIAETEQSAKNEKYWSVEILTRELKYILDSATTYGEPVYQQDDDGRMINIGKLMVVLDRSRLVTPSIAIKENYTILDCVREKEESNEETDRITG
jgi:hypothetical protein